MKPYTLTRSKIVDIVKGFLLAQHPDIEASELKESDRPISNWGMSSLVGAELAATLEVCYGVKFECGYNLFFSSSKISIENELSISQMTDEVLRRMSG